ncbi:bidirectional sugar transporter SWEET16-like [Euphorbia lathyris]|uniref:bidirectional sugar transporter SWEET16-like n=1 Tax=Euphorbia lathyris TaxID=212925 RepID=UPI0033143A1A
MEDNLLLTFVIGIIGNLISLLVFISPIKTFCGVVKKKSTENYKVDPYITTLLSTSLWSFYGILNPDGLLILTINGTGVVFQSVYLTLFIIYAPKDKKIRTAKLVGLLNVGFVGLVIAVTLFAIHGRHLRLTVVGLLCSAFTIAMYAAPLSAMRLVIKTKSVEYMPFFLSFFLFLNGCVWGTYALLLKDFYIGVPNAVGFILGSTQLILYAIYRNKSSSTTESMDEEMHSPSFNKNNNNKIEKDEEKEGGSIDDHDGKNRNLTQIKSLPNPSVDRQTSLKNIIKTVSLNACDLQSANWFNSLNDVRNGKI